MEYNEDDFLALSGLQHFAFCRRQWALIHIEQQWAENLRTTEGHLMHERAHDEALRERRGDMLILRGVRIRSASLGVSGQCDILEFHTDPEGVALPGEDGTWLPFPVEYKRGSPKAADADRLHLCAQAMCLEEMLCFPIEEGALFYGETRRRELVRFTPELRGEVERDLSEMHTLYARGHTPAVKPTKSCSACSLKDLCLPQILRGKSVKSYLASAMED